MITHQEAVDNREEGIVAAVFLSDGNITRDITASLIGFAFDLSKRTAKQVWLKPCSTTGRLKNEMSLYSTKRTR